MPCHLTGTRFKARKATMLHLTHLINSKFERYEGGDQSLEETLWNEVKHVFTKKKNSGKGTP